MEGGPQPVTDHEILEEMAPILGEKFRGKNDDRGRKKAFASAQALSDTAFDTTTTYTFDYFQQFLRSDQVVVMVMVQCNEMKTSEKKGELCHRLVGAHEMYRL